MYDILNQKTGMASATCTQPAVLQDAVQNQTGW